MIRNYLLNSIYFIISSFPITPLAIIINLTLTIHPMNRRRNSVVVEDYVPNINLNKAQQQQLQVQFKKLPQTNGGITFYDMLNIIKNYYNVGEQERTLLLKEIAFKEMKVLDSNALIWAVSFIKRLEIDKQGEQKKEENEYYDAFVALGGNPDKSGYVSRNTLMKTIIDEFGMSLDMNGSINGLQGLDQERLNYEEFCELFQNKENKEQENPENASGTRVRTDTMKTVQINEDAFYEYLAKLGGDE